jgi:hypothetical protein
VLLEMRGAGHGSMKKHRHSGVKAARLSQQARNRAHAASVNDLIRSLNASHVSARSATRQRLLSQKRSQGNPFKLAAFKGKKLNTINELTNLFRSMTSKVSKSTVRRKKGNKMSLEPTRRSARHSRK